MYLRAQALTNITGNKGHHQLLRFGALTAGFWYHVLVQHLNGSLETGKLHHGVGDLPQPQGKNTFIEPAQMITSTISSPAHNLRLLKSLMGNEVHFVDHPLVIFSHYSLKKWFCFFGMVQNFVSFWHLLYEHTQMKIQSNFWVIIYNSATMK